MASTAEHLVADPEVDALLHWMERATDGRLGDAEWAFGGGSALAAHWKHRRSTDLAVFVPYGAYLDWTAHGGAQELLERLAGTYPHAKAHRVDAAGDAAVKFSGLELHGNALGRPHGRSCPYRPSWPGSCSDAGPWRSQGTCTTSRSR